MPVKGRAYTMKELKGIVEYLVEHKAYGEVRGRKMWLDYASTGFTSRTWQSLKETFLKRILPDIHNPYYKLSKEEIRSFRMGIEILPANKGESTSKDNNTANGEPSTSYNVTKEEGNTSGEEYQVSKVTSSRESVETVILSTDECYNNAQDLIKVLESPGSSPQTSPKKTLSLRDCITYSEPLTPMLQEIIDDFETDAEDHVFEPEVILETGKEGPITEKEKEKEKTNTECIDLTTQEEVPKVMKGGEGPDEKEKINSNEDGAPDECIDLTTQEEAQEMVKEGEVLNDKEKINGNENYLSEAAEKTTKMSLRLKKGAKDKTKNISTETSNLLFLSNISVFHNTLSGQEVENTVPKEVNKEDLSKTNEKAKNLSTDTNESDVLEVQNTEPEEEVDTTKKCGSEAPEAVKEDNVSKIDKKKGLKDTIPDEGNKDEASKTNNTTESNLVITNGSDVQVIENGITGNVNKESTVGDKTDGNTKEINQENDEIMNKTNLETQDTQKPMEHSSSTVTDSLIPNNQEALLNRPDDKESPEKHDAKTQEPEKVGKITTKRDSKAKSVEKTIKKTEKKNRKLFSKSQKRQRKLYSTTESIALAEVKRTTLDGVSEHFDNEKPGISEKLQKSLTKFLNKKSSKDNKHLKPAAETSKDPDETHHEDVIDTQESYPTLTRILNEKSSKDLKFTEDNTNEGKHPKPPAETSKEPDEIQHDDILDTQESHQSTNPCLQSVSLFDEQFLLLKSDSDNETTTEDKPTGNTEKEKLATKNSKKKPKENIVQEVIDTRNRESTSVESINDACLISNQNNVVILKSHSESETTEDIQPTSRKRTHRDISRNQKKEVLNDLFGNTSGTVSKKRQRNPSYRNGSAHRKNITESSESSEWVSESDGEYVSPPRARHRQSKRYLRPQSSRLLQMQQEGALFVAVGRKVYPLVRDDGLAVNYVNYVSGSNRPQSSRLLQMQQEGALFVAVGREVYPLVRDDGLAVNYVNYVSGSESEEDDSYWKLKYVKERKKNEQLAKQLEKANDECADKIIRPALFDSPILPTTSSKKPRRISINDDVKSNEEVKGTELVPIKEKEEPKGETVKIKYAKNNEEIFVEGPWQNVHTILSDVMQVFKRDSISLPEPTTKNAANTPSERVSSRNTLSNSVVQKKGASPVIEVSSGKTTPLNGVVDEEVRKKVEQLERKIFEEIEEKDKSVVNLQVPKEVLVFERENNLQISEEDHGTEKRKRGRPKNLASNPNSPLPSTVGSSKRTKTSSETESVTNNNNKRASRNAKPSIDLETAPPERKSRQAKAAEARLEREAKSPSEGGSRTDSEIIVNESRLQLIEDVPGRSRRRPKPPAKLSYDNAEPSPKQKNMSIPEDDSQILYKFPSPPSATTRASRSKKYLPRTPQISSPSDNTQNSLESSHGYQDSDLSPQSGHYKRKKKCSLPIYRAKERLRYNRRRHTFNAFECDASSESSNSSFRFPIRNITVTNSSLNTEVYRSESYQLLVPKPRYFFPLEKINESPCPNELDAKSDVNCLKLSPASQNMGSRSELGNSSNVSLPMSPELSIVEHISLSKDDLERAPEHPTINETISNDEMKSRVRDSFVISNVDVSVPLMEQKCNFHIYQDSVSSNLSQETERRSISPNITSHVCEIPVKGITVTESLLDRMDTASIEGSVTTNDLDVRLTNLLLESAKKIAAQNKKAAKISDKDVVEKKQNSRKRCSTPRKKKETKKAQTPTVEPVIEECMEFCHAGRKSCPPVLCENSILIDTSEPTKVNSKTTTKKPKSPKEVIKVKIQRPKKKDEPAPKRPNTRSQSKLSILTDSGITADTSLLLQSMDETVDFIHNHSDTCLQGHDCLSPSVEFIENSPNPILSVDSSSASTKADEAKKPRRNARGSIKEDEPKKPRRNEKDSSKVNAAKRRRNVRDSMTPEFFCCDAQGASSLDKSSQKSPLKLCPTQTQYHSTHCSSLMTEDLSDDPPPPSNQFNKWYLLSEDENSNTLQSRPASCSMTSSCGSNLRQLFPVICAVPDLSDITEFSRETEGLSRKSTRNTDLDSNMMRSEFLLSDFHDDSVLNGRD